MPGIIALVKELLVTFFTKFIVAIVILFIGFIAGKILGRVLQKILHELDLNRIVRSAGVKLSLEEMIGSLASYFIYFLTIIMALNQAGLTTTILNIIGAAAITVIIIAFFLSVKDFIPNMMAGIMIHQKRIIEVGDRIKFREIKGKVVEITLLETRVETANNDLIYIPNSNFTRSEVLRVTRKKHGHDKGSDEGHRQDRTSRGQ